MRTLEDVTRIAGTKVLDYLDTTVTIPLSAGLQRQGDVGLLPIALVGYGVPTDGKPVGAAGVALVDGNGGHTHLLVADGPVLWSPIVRPRELGDVGIFTVPDGSAAYVLHPEHGAMGHAPGSYLVRRQVEMADELRLVQD